MPSTPISGTEGTVMRMLEQQTRMMSELMGRLTKLESNVQPAEEDPFAAML